MANLQVKFLGKTLLSPIIGASGTYGYGVEYADMVDFSKIGGVSSKGLTLNPKAGNTGERLWETPSGLMNSIGLQNPGIKHFIQHELPQMKILNTAIFANLGGNCAEDYQEGAKLLSETEIDFIELNISCPNVKQGGIAYGIRSENAKEIVQQVRAVCKKPLIVKLSPNAENIVEMAQACVEAGADALSLVNTFQAMAIDLERRKTVFDNGYAGLSGAAIRPIALRMVHQVCKNVTVPVIGLGGITTGRDALEFIMAGATAVQVGTANFANPKACMNIADEMIEWMDKNQVTTLDEIRGCV